MNDKGHPGRHPQYLTAERSQNWVDARNRPDGTDFAAAITAFSS